jgi:hypothetical protein
MTEPGPRRASGNSNSKRQMFSANLERDPYCVGRNDPWKIGEGRDWIDTRSVGNRVSERDLEGTIRWKLEMPQECASCPYGFGKCAGRPATIMRLIN